MNIIFSSLLLVISKKGKTKNEENFFRSFFHSKWLLSFLVSYVPQLILLFSFFVCPILDTSNGNLQFSEKSPFLDFSKIEHVNCDVEIEILIQNNLKTFERIG